jgi:alpha-tubulin suppressor-like RCC1 family protein
VELAGNGWWNGPSAYHFCARTAKGRVRCWGETSDCCSVDLTPSPTAPNDPKNDLKDVIQLAAASNADCALRADGTVWCWGNNGHGQLGQGDLGTHPETPIVQVPNLTGVRAIGAGVHHFCAITGQEIYCWGVNDDEQLGGGAMQGMDVPKPSLVTATAGLHDVVQVTGTRRSTCALTAAGDVYCWGANCAGELGTGDTMGQSCPNDPLCSCVPTPVQSKVTGVAEIATLGNGVIVRLKSGGLKAWGANGAGELGSGQIDPSASGTPSDVLDFP